MMVVKVELWPGGDHTRAREVGRMALANVSDLDRVSDYTYVAEDDRGGKWSGSISSHRRNAGFWPLLAAIFQAMDADPDAPIPAKHRGASRSLWASFGTSTSPKHTLGKG